MTAEGALAFGRYAFPPNRLGYCGPDDSEALLEQVSAGRSDRGLLEMERRFEGAYPYLRLIAMANDIADPFDARVVDAYWIGNRLLERVSPALFHGSLEDRFHGRMTASEFAWLGRKVEMSARPHHNFHVFDIYVRTGLIRGERAEASLEVMDSCRISWGRVIRAEGADLIVERPELVIDGGKLGLSEPRALTVRRQAGGLGFVNGAGPGDFVSIHWTWACDLLSGSALDRLRSATKRSLDLANLTI